MVDQRKRELPGLHILARGLAECRGPAGQVEQVVLDLERDAERATESFESRALLFVGARGLGAEPARKTDQARCLADNDLGRGRSGV
jgi:hypothetical protein